MNDTTTLSPVYDLSLRMGDNALILAQQASAWCGHAPVLEEDIALANVALDLIGQAKYWLGYAGEIEGNGRSADDLAFLRDGKEFRNVLLVEQPNGDFAKTLMRQFLFDSCHYFMVEALKSSVDERVRDIAGKAFKEVSYHRERSTDLVIRLGDGSEESHQKMQDALGDLWPFVGELSQADEIDDAIAEQQLGPDLAKVGEKSANYLLEALKLATLKPPLDAAIRSGGKVGVHSEKFGILLAEMQIVQRSNPGATW